MSRDYRKLRAFQCADDVVLEVYRVTRGFPKDEMFGLTSQMRRAAVSVAANIVEGSFRTGEAEYINFLTISLGSAGELGYYLELAQRLTYLKPNDFRRLSEKHGPCMGSLQALVRYLRSHRSEAAKSPKPKV